MNELTRDELFDGTELNIDRVTEMIQQEPWRTKEILEFIAHEMRKEVEFNEKLDHLKHEYHHKKKALYEEYGMEYLEE